MSLTTTRPDGTASNVGPWNFTGASAHASLQAVTQPTVPAATPNISVAAGDGQNDVVTFSLADMPGDFGTSIDFRVWFYAQVQGNAAGTTTATMTLNVALRNSGGTLIVSKNVIDGGAGATGWQSSVQQASVQTLATCNGMRLVLTALDDILTCVVKSAYVDINYNPVGGGAARTIRLSLSLAALELDPYV